jgi:xanthine dehydrogenase iron-sulfur cluster and FAD-binding subunit A
LAGDLVEQASIVLGSIASLPSRAIDAERELQGKRLTEESIRAAAEKTRSAATPMDNTDLDPRWRGQVTPVYVARSLRAAAGLTPPG